MTSTSIVKGAASFVLLLVAACSSPSLGPPELISSLDGYVIEPFVPGECAFDLRSQVSRVDAATGEISWTVDVPHLGSRDVGVIDGVAVVETSSGPVGLDAVTGEPAWQRIDEHVGRLSYPATWVIDVDYSRNRVVRLDPSTGQEIWSQQLSEAPALGGVTDGDTLFINDDGAIRALDPTSGEQRWSTETIGDSSFAPEWSGDGLYATAFEGKVYRIAADSGTVTWTWSARPGVAVIGDVYVDGGRALFTTRGSSGADGDLVPPEDADRLIAADAVTGTQLWSIRLTERELGLDGVIQPGYPVAVGNGLALIHRPLGGVLDAVSTEDGTVRWSLAVPEGDLGVAADGDRSGVYIATWRHQQSGTLHAMDPKTGTSRWARDIGPVATASVSILDGTVLVAKSVTYDSAGVGLDRQGHLLSIDSETGSAAWEAMTRDGAQTALRLDDGALLVLSSDPFIGCH